MWRITCRGAFRRLLETGDGDQGPSHHRTVAGGDIGDSDVDSGQTVVTAVTVATGDRG